MRLPVRLQGVLLRELGATLIADQGLGTRWGEKGRAGLVQAQKDTHLSVHLHSAAAINTPAPWRGFMFNVPRAASKSSASFSPVLLFLAHHSKIQSCLQGKDYYYFLKSLHINAFH